MMLIFSKIYHSLNIQTLWKKPVIHVLLCLLACLMFLHADLPIQPQQPDKEIIILHTNDLHSRLVGYAPESSYTPLKINDDNTVGGFARIARIIKEERRQNPDKVLVLDAGDFLMGTFFHALEPIDGFQLNLMKNMGYDAISLGNHEFDFGVQVTAQMINAAVKNGGVSSLLLSNIKFDPVKDGDDDLNELFDNGIIKHYEVIEKNGIRIGLFGLIGYDAGYVAPFALPAKFTDPIKTAKKITRQLKQEEKVDMIICLSHSGLTKNEKGMWDGEDAKLAKKVKGIDLIISGHTHSVLNEPLIINGTLIVQAGSYGSHVGRLHLVMNQDEIKSKESYLIKIDDSIMGDFKTHAAVQNQKTRIQNVILEGLNLSYDKPVVTAGFDLGFDEQSILENSNLGPFIADALWYYVNSTGGESTDVSMVAAGVIRDQVSSGKQTIADIFRVSSLGRGYDSMPGYPLAKVYITGNELKKIIEVLLTSYKSNSGHFCYYSGIQVDYNPEKGILRKISSIRMGDENNGYHEIDISKDNDTLYGLVANAYLLEFVGILKKKTYGLANVIPKDKLGVPYEDLRKSIIDFDIAKEGLQEGKEWIAIYEYVSTFEDSDLDGIPDIPEKYRNPFPRLIPSNK